MIAHSGGLEQEAVEAWRLAHPIEGSCPTGSSSSGLAPVQALPTPIVLAVPLSGPSCPALKLMRGSIVLKRSEKLYELGAKIGEGSFGEVYLAKRKLPDSLGGFDLAVKRMRSVDVKAVWSEAYLLDRCRDHPHIVQLVDIFQSAVPVDRLNLVFGYGGRDLKAIMHDGPVHPARVRDAVVHVLSGLGHLHGIGLVHGDLKPENILVSEQGDRWLCRLGDLGGALEARIVFVIIVSKRSSGRIG